MKQNHSSTAFKVVILGFAFGTVSASIRNMWSEYILHEARHHFVMETPESLPHYSVEIVPEIRKGSNGGVEHDYSRINFTLPDEPNRSFSYEFKTRAFPDSYFNISIIPAELTTPEKLLDLHRRACGILKDFSAPDPLFISSSAKKELDGIKDAVTFTLELHCQ